MYRAFDGIRDNAGHPSELTGEASRRRVYHTFAPVRASFLDEAAYVLVHSEEYGIEWHVS